MNSSVSESTKPRGVVDLSKIQDVKPASSVTGRPNSIQLKTSSGGSVSYICDTETEMVEWISAIDGSIQKIVKTLAGVEDEPAPPARSTSSSAAAKKGSSSEPSAEWIKQLEKNFDNLSTSSATASRSHSHRERDHSHRERDHYGSSGFNGNAIVEVVGYDGGAGGGRSAGNGYNNSSSTSGRDREGGYSGGGSGLGYGSIAGVAGVAGGLSADTMLNYAPDYSGRGGSSNDYRQQTGTSSGPGGYGGGAYGGSSYGVQQQGGGYSQPAQYGVYGSQVQQSQQGGGASLIDAVPHSTPAYPYYQQGMAAPASSAPVMQSQWQVHHTPEGKPYYYNTATGVTQVCSSCAGLACHSCRSLPFAVSHGTAGRDAHMPMSAAARTLLSASAVRCCCLCTPHAVCTLMPCTM